MTSTEKGLHIINQKMSYTEKSLQFLL